MTDKEELIKAAETFEKFCDSFPLCNGCPLVGVCDSVYLASTMRDIKDTLEEDDYD